MEQKYGGNLPPGFRFHPTDEELIMYYLRNQATSKPLPVSIIPEIDIYKFDPWELPEKSEFQENEWYFFSPRDRKYPNGVRPNRATVSGYWKATGTDKAIYSGTKYVGVKKALVFYKGRPPKGIKTDWIMHEYRLNDSRRRVGKQSGSMRLDDWVLCRIYKKRQSSGNATGKVFQEVKVEEPLVQNGKPGGLIYNNENLEQQMMMKFPRTCSITQLFELECFGPISQLLGDNNSYQQHVDHQKVQTGGIPYQHQQQNTDSDKLQVNQTGILNQHPVAVTGNPVFYHFQ